MLSEKPWKSEAILRLVVSIIICALVGSIVLAAVRFYGGPHLVNGWAFTALLIGSLASNGGALFILRKAWDLDRFTRPFALMIFFFYLGLALGAFVHHFAGQPVDSNPAWYNLVMVLSGQGAAVILLWRFTREHGTTWSAGFGFPKQWKLALLYGGLAACSFLPIGWLLQTGAIKLMTVANLKPAVQPAVQALNHAVTWWDRVALGIAAVGIAPLGEELVFRGVLYPAVKQAGFPRLATWGTSLLFAAIHRNLMTFVPLLVLALLLVWLYEATDNLLAAITTHAVFNGMQFAIFYLLPLAADRFEWLRRFVGGP